MKLALVKGTTSKIIHLFVQDSSATDGSGLAGLAYDTASLVCYYIRPGDAGETEITLADATIGTWVSGGFKEVNAATVPGLYEFGVPDACLADGADQVTIMLHGAADMAPLPLEIELTDFDLHSTLNDPTAAAVADAVWDEDVVAAHNTADTAGALIDDLGTPADFMADVSNLDAAVSSRSSHSAEDVADAVWDEAATGHIDAGKAGEQLWTDVDAILVDTNELQTDDIPTTLATISGYVNDLETRLTAARAGYLDELAAANIPTDIDAILADTGTDGVVLSDGAITAAKIAADAITDAKIADDVDTYQAKVWPIDDDANGYDRYTCAWFKNGEPVTTGITSPTIQIIKASDGTDRVTSTDMTQIGETGLYKYDEDTNRMVNGAVYFAKAQATIGGSTRTWYQQIGRDSSS